MSPVRRTWVPPHSSVEKILVGVRRSWPPIETTRTSSPYFSPNSAIAPASTASCGVISRVSTVALSQDAVVDLALHDGDVLGRQRLGVAEVEAQAVGRDQRALLRHVRAEPAAQRLVQQVGRRVVGADGGAARP